MAKLINGNGNPAIYAAEDADLIASLAGNVTCIANVGNKYAATEEDATTIRLDDGVIITKEGRRIQLEAGESDTFYIPTGTSGQTNYYIIGYKLVQNADSTQVAEQFVQKMNSSSETITEDTFRSGATEVYVSVYRVTQVGFTIDSISGLLPELLDNASIKDNIYQINSDLSDKVSKTGDTISGDLSISGNLTVQNINAFLHNKVSGVNVAWKDCPLTTDGWYYYESANITTYDLPFTHCIVQVYKRNAARGVAIAYRWDNGCPMTWINNLHDTWRGWKSIGSNYITLKAAATYSSPTIVTLAETMLNYSKLAFNLLEGDQVVDYVEVPVRRFQAGNYFVLHSKQTDNSYALIVRHPENMNNEVNIAVISGSPKIEIQGIY